VADHTLAAPHREIRRIVLLGDSGCRMKASENAFQHCLAPSAWPFAQIARLAADMAPDLVVHVGDLHYRESPCPIQRPGCTNSPWGYGFDAWQADFFEPARPLLARAPWVFVRGNHESCARAGQGWFRWLDSQPWTPTRSCDLTLHDDTADYSAPYAVALSDQTQLLVFDSSKTSGKALPPTSVAYRMYRAQLEQVQALAAAKPNNLFLSHHPLQVFKPVRDGQAPTADGNRGLQSVFSALYPDTLLPPSVSLALHGHVHVFEAISFDTPHPVSLVLGNSGSLNEGAPPASMPPGTPADSGARVADYATQPGYGFATLDMVGEARAGHWLLTEYNAAGQALIRCDIQHKTSRCRPV